MEDCKTPTYQQLEFTFNTSLTPNVVTEVSRLQDVQRLCVNKINVRSFTPTLEDFRSPGLSPIYAIKKRRSEQFTAKTDSEFKTPIFLRKKNRYIPTPTGLLKKHQQKHKQEKEQIQKQKQQQKQKSKEQIQSSSPKKQQNPQQQSNEDSNNISLEISINLSLKLSPSETDTSADSSTSAQLQDSMSSLLNCSFNVAPLLETDTSADSFTSAQLQDSMSSLLNRSFNVASLLKTLNLMEYYELFLRANIDVEKFLQIEQTDLQRIGIRTEEHQKSILSYVNELSGLSLLN